MILIRILKVLDLLLQALEVYPAPLDLLVKVLDRLFELLDVVGARFSGPLESGEVDLLGHGLSPPQYQIHNCFSRSVMVLDKFEPGHN